MDFWQAELQQMMATASAPPAWAPPTGTDVWWRASADVAGGGNWVDSIGGKAIAVAADCSVIAGTGLVAPVGHTTLMTSNYTPASGGGAGKGHSLAFWMWIESCPTNVQVIGIGSNTQYIRSYASPNRVIPITVYGTVNVVDITTDFSGGEGRWWHLAVAQYWGDDAGQTGKHAEFYVDGALKTTLNVGTRTNAALALSAMAVGFAGKLDDIIAAPRALTAGEVADIYAHPTGNRA